MWSKIWLWIKNIFTGLYRKEIIDIEDFNQIMKTADVDDSGKLSANEIWDFVIDMIKK